MSNYFDALSNEELAETLLEMRPHRPDGAPLIELLIALGAYDASPGVDVSVIELLDLASRHEDIRQFLAGRGAEVVALGIGVPLESILLAAEQGTIDLQERLAEDIESEIMFRKNRLFRLLVESDDEVERDRLYADHDAGPTLHRALWRWLQRHRARCRPRPYRHRAEPRCVSTRRSHRRRVRRASRSAGGGDPGGDPDPSPDSAGPRAGGRR